MTIKLSICIPTYNRAPFIQETLDSILAQITDEIEIVVSDNASTDNTEELIQRYQEKCNRLTYFRWDSNQGADRNYLRAVELAKGEYCWLMGSDDALMSGAIYRMLGELRSGYDIYLCNRVMCDFSLVPINKQYWLGAGTDDRVFDFTNNRQASEYLQSASSIGALFSYLSTIIVKSSAWRRIPFDISFIGTAYSHVYILLSLITAKAALKYIKEPLVLCRGGNDSFASEGGVKRFLIDLDGYDKLAHKTVDVSLRKKFLKVMTLEHRLMRLIKIRALTNSNEWLEIEARLKKFGFSRWKIAVASWIGKLKPLVLASLYLKKRFAR